jgi:hypothetical protein
MQLYVLDGKRGLAIMKMTDDVCLLDHAHASGPTSKSESHARNLFRSHHGRRVGRPSPRPASVS